MRAKQKRESLRKIIHLAFLIIPFSYHYLFSNRKTFLFFLVPLTMLSLIIDISRLKHPTIKRIFNDLVGILLRKHELNDFTGATYMMISSVFCVALCTATIRFSIYLGSFHPCCLRGGLYHGDRAGRNPIG